jgi:two-component system nitrogen regulation response regulator GlnG/two-component system response regulator HydG
VPLLALHLLRRAPADDATLGPRFFEGWGTGRAAPRIDLALMRALVEHHFTSHVRELDRILWTAMASSEGETIELTADVQRDLQRGPPRAPSQEPTPQVIREALARHDGVQERVWRELGLPNRYALRRLLRKHRIGQEP